MNLYEMTVAASELYDLLTNGEIDDQTFEDTLAAMGTEEKLESYCKVIRQLEADTEMLKAEKDRIEKKKKAVDNSVDRMKKAVVDFMKAQGTDKATAGTFSVALSKSKAVNVLDESKVPKKYFIKQDPKLDKKTIRELLMQGEKVRGCELQTNEGVRIK